MDGKMECGKTQRNKHLTEGPCWLQRAASTVPQKLTPFESKWRHGFVYSLEHGSNHVQVGVLHKESFSCFLHIPLTCRFDPLPGATNNIRGARTVRIATSGVQKKGFTVALCASAAGEKLPAYIIFKERGGKLGPRVKAALTSPENVKVSASTNGRMTREELHHWIRGVCDFRIWAYFLRNPVNLFVLYYVINP